MIHRVHEYSAYKFREIADDDVNLHEDTGLKRGTRAVWPDNNVYVCTGCTYIYNIHHARANKPPRLEIGLFAKKYVYFRLQSHKISYFLIRTVFYVMVQRARTGGIKGEVG